MESRSVYQDPEAWALALDPRAKVGSRHHVVPRFLLERWADQRGLVSVRSKVDGNTAPRNVKDIGITDFYTFVSITGELDASFEDILGIVETEASDVIRALMHPFNPLRRLRPDQALSLANFVAFQMVRGPRRRREFEIQADWLGKTLLASELRKHVSDAELRGYEFTPHQNEHLRVIGQAAAAMAENVIERPVALVTVDRPLFFIGDEPVIVNTGGDHVRHHPDCFMTDEEFEAKLKRERRRKAKRQRDVRRVVHLAPTQPRGVDLAVELVIPISPRTLLVWGPQEGGWHGLVEHTRVDGPEADEVAVKVNEHQIEWSLDTIVGRIEDTRLHSLHLPEPKPLMTVCDGSGPAKDAVNTVPSRIRPRRLDKSADTLARAAAEGRES